MGTVLGLSVTTTSVGWVLVDDSDADGVTIDHDAFDVVADVGDTAGYTAQRLAAVRGAKAIATASGHHVHSIGVTWSDDVAEEAALLLESLPDLGSDDVIAVPLEQATTAWARGIGRDLGYQKSAVCIIEPAAVTVLSVDSDGGGLQTAVTHSRDSASVDGLSKWLTDVFDREQRKPESLLLVGSRTELDAIAGSLDEALPMPVFASVEAQLSLARGVALALANNADASAVQVGEDKPAHGRSWPRSQSWASPVAAAGLVAVVFTLFSVAPDLAALKASRPAYPPVADTSGTPVRSHVVPPLVSAPPAPPLPTMVAEPPQAPAPTVAPAVSLAVPLAEPTVATVQPERPAAVAPVSALQQPLGPPPPASNPQNHLAPAPVAPAPPPLAPAPVAPEPAPLAPPPPPPDPLAGLLSPIFGALP